MIQVLAHATDGWFIKASNRNEGLAALPMQPQDFKTAWFDVTNPTPEELAWLGSHFHFHPLALEDCSHFDQRPKIEQYTDHLFVVLNGFRMAKGLELSLYEVHFFLTKTALITVHDGWVEPLTRLKDKIEGDRNQLPLAVDFLFYKIVDSIMDANPVALGKIEAEIDRLDEEVLGEATQSHLEEVHLLRQQLNLGRRSLLPQKDIFYLLVHDQIPEISEKAQLYFRDILDHLIRVIELVEELRESLSAIRDVYLAMAAHRTNETMKRLMVFSVVFLPLTFLTGFFGMNFELIPWRNPFLFWGIFVATVSVPAVMLIWFQKRKWL